MGYSEKDGQVVLTMSREDYENLLIWLRAATVAQSRSAADWDRILSFLNRLNQGNPNYTPYQVGEKSER